MTGKLSDPQKTKGYIRRCCSDVRYGVPQGSILDPLLFLVYVNDLVTDLECDPHLFADDTSIFTNPLTSSLTINRDIQRIYKWGTPVRVKFKPIKTIYQIMSNRKNGIYPNLIFDGVVINRSIENVHLGLTIKSNISWQRHIDQVIFEANKIIYVMKNIKTNYHETRNVPCINPCCCVSLNIVILFLTIAQSELNVQRRAASTCTGAYKHTSNDRLLLELNWIPQTRHAI